MWQMKNNITTASNLSLIVAATATPSTLTEAAPTATPTTTGRFYNKLQNICTDNKHLLKKLLGAVFLHKWILDAVVKSHLVYLYLPVCACQSVCWDVCLYGHLPQ